MNRYVEGYVIPVKKARVEDYRKLAEDAAKIYLEYGALEVEETIADDVKPGTHTSFPQAVKLEHDETVVFSYIVFPSREKRDEVHEKVMKDPRMNSFDINNLPFDSKRMFWGGFKTIVRSQA